MVFNKKYVFLSMCYFLCMFFLGTPVAYADNFNYTSSGECKNAMFNYYQKTNNIIEKYPYGSKEWYGFMRMSLFFWRFHVSGNSSHIVCNNGNCVFESSAINCAWADRTDKAPWKLSIETLLTEETNYLNRGQYDSAMTGNTDFVITCTYPEKSEIDWNKCIMVRKD